MKADIGFHQEQQPNGKIANSWMRKWESIFGVMTLIYLAISCYFYFTARAVLITAVVAKTIDGSTYSSIMLTLNVVDLTVFIIMVTATFAPKALQKFAEMKTGVKDTDEQTTT